MLPLATEKAPCPTAVAGVSMLGSSLLRRRPMGGVMVGIRGERELLRVLFTLSKEEKG